MSATSDFARLAALLVDLERIVAEGDGALRLRAPRVSAWSVGQQVDHALRVMNRSLAAVLEPGTAPARGINLAGRVILFVGRIPRGIGKAPAAAQGQESPVSELEEFLAAARRRLDAARRLDDRLRDRRPVLRHPYFRGLTRAQALRFLAVHTDHHLRIVADIRRRAARLA